MASNTLTFRPTVRQLGSFLTTLGLSLPDTFCSCAPAMCDTSRRDGERKLDVSYPSTEDRGTIGAIEPIKVHKGS